jgi:hypothetical protein
MSWLFGIDLDFSSKQNYYTNRIKKNSDNSFVDKSKNNAHEFQNIKN